MTQHCSDKDLQLYHMASLPIEKRRVFEEHLLTCRMCTQRLLLGITDEDVEQAENDIPASFTEDTMAWIVRDYHRLEEQEKPDCTRHSRLLFYYAAAAILTLAFVGGGIFQNLVDSTVLLSEQGIYKAPQAQTAEAFWKWPDVITDSTAQWMDAFSNNQTDPIKTRDQSRWKLPVPRLHRSV